MVGGGGTIRTWMHHVDVEICVATVAQHLVLVYTSVQVCGRWVSAGVCQVGKCRCGRWVRVRVTTLPFRSLS